MDILKILMKKKLDWSILKYQIGLIKLFEKKPFSLVSKLSIIQESLVLVKYTALTLVISTSKASLPHWTSIMLYSFAGYFWA